MAEERLSKLQKYILTAAYKKTILKEALPIQVWRFAQYLGNSRRPANDNGTLIVYEENKYDKLYRDLYFSALYESDILMNFYGLYTADEKYGYTGGSNKEKTALTRSLKTLYERGYINPYWQWSQDAGEIKNTYFFAGQPISVHEVSYQSRAIITLTDKGEKKAAELLNVS